MDIRSKIEKRAYELFLARGARHGYHMQDWQQAEKEVLAEVEAQQKATKKEEQKPVSKAEPKTAAPQKPAEPEQKKKAQAEQAPAHAKKKVAPKKK